MRCLPLMFLSVRSLERLLDHRLAVALAPLMKEIKVTQAQDDAIAAALAKLQGSVDADIAEVTSLVTAVQAGGVSDPNLDAAVTKLNAMSAALDASVAAAQTAIAPVVAPPPSA